MQDNENQSRGHHRKNLNINNVFINKSVTQLTTFTIMKWYFYNLLGECCCCCEQHILLAQWWYLWIKYATELQSNRTTANIRVQDRGWDKRETCLQGLLSTEMQLSFYNSHLCTPYTLQQHLLKTHHHGRACTSMFVVSLFVVLMNVCSARMQDVARNTQKLKIEKVLACIIQVLLFFMKGKKDTHAAQRYVQMLS